MLVPLDLGCSLYKETRWFDWIVLGFVSWAEPWHWHHKNKDAAAVSAALLHSTAHIRLVVIRKYEILISSSEMKLVFPEDTSLHVIQRPASGLVFARRLLKGRMNDEMGIPVTTTLWNHSDRFLHFSLIHTCYLPHTHTSVTDTDSPIHSLDIFIQSKSW